MALTWGWQFLLGVRAAVYYSIFFYVCWHCLAEDGGGGMKNVNLVQNNSINCFKLSKMLFPPSPYL